MTNILGRGSEITKMLTRELGFNWTNLYVLFCWGTSATTFKEMSFMQNSASLYSFKLPGMGMKCFRGVAVASV